MSSNVNVIHPFSKIKTGIPGLDLITSGGLLRGGTYLIMGPPGSGKTILANQIAFQQAFSNSNVLYVSLLAENHARLFGHLATLDFFKQDLLSTKIEYLSAYSVLEEKGLKGLFQFIGKGLIQSKASLLVIDGVASAQEISQSPINFKKFVHELNTIVSVIQCTTLLLSSEVQQVSAPEHTMVDGIIAMDLVRTGMQTFRELEVIKLRGSGHIHGRHFCRITNEGLIVYPRSESYMGLSPKQPLDVLERCAFKIEKLDRLLEGGLVRGSVTSVLGSAGTGKTLLGMQFLAGGIQQSETCVYFTFYESPDRIQKQAEQIGLNLSESIKSGKLQILWRAPLEHFVDELIADLIQAVKKTKASRLFIDGIAGLRSGFIVPDRITKTFVALSNELRSHGVTTVFTEETELFCTDLKVPISDLSAVTDNIIYMRYVEVESKLKRLVAVMKARMSAIDSSIYEMKITDRGILVGDKLEYADRLFSGKSNIKAELKIHKSKLHSSSKRNLRKKNRSSRK